MHFGRKLTILLLFALVGHFARAQSAANGAYTITASQCAEVDSSNTGTIGVSVSNSGTAWSGTIQPAVAINGDAFTNTLVTPAGSTTPQATITANGVYYASTSGSTVFRVCGNTVTNKASIKFYPTKIAGGGGRGGGGGGATPFAGVPSGSCTTLQTAVDTTTGNFYSCNAGVWLLIGPGAAGSAAFSTLTAGTNAGQALHVGNGSTLDATGTGTINATALNGKTFADPAAIGTGTPAAVTGTAASFTSGNFSTTLAATGHVTFEGVTSTGATGTGKLVFDGSPVLVTPNLGTPSALNLTNATSPPTWNQNTTGSAAKWTTARALAGNSVDGSAAVPFANSFVVGGTTDAGLTGAQFLGALGTGIVKNTTTTGALTIAVAGDFPTLNQNTSGTAASAAKWTTARNLAGNSTDGSANVAFANKFIVQGTADAGLSAAQFLGALGTGILKNTTTTGILSAAASADVIALFSGCSGTQSLGADGACHTAGTGTATSVGLAGTANQITVTGATPITRSGAWTLSLPSSLAIPGDMTIPAANSLSFVGQSLFLAADASASVADFGSTAGGTDAQINAGSYTATGAAAGSFTAKPGNGTCPTPTALNFVICNNGGTGFVSISQNGGGYAGLAILGSIPFDTATGLAQPGATADASFTFGATHGVTFAGTAPASTSSNGTDAGNLFTIQTPAGGVTTGAGTTAGVGGNKSEGYGNGGSAAGGSGNARGGTGGGVHVTTGDGGVSINSAVNSSGGDDQHTMGSPGTGGGGGAGANGRFIIDQKITNAIASSPKLILRGNYEATAGPTYANDDWSLSDVLQASTVNGNTTLTLAHAGSSGTAAVSVPNLINTGSTAHGVQIGEATSPVVSIIGAADTILMGNDAGTGSDPAFKAGPSGGTNGCAGTSDTVRYNTSTHAWSCGTISGSGTVNSGTASHLAYYASSTTAVSDAGADLVFDGTHTYTGSSALIFNLGAGPVLTGFKVPTAAGAAPTASGQKAYNSTTNTFVGGSNGTTLVEAVAATGTNTATTCSNQFVTAISGIAAPTCSTITLASAAFANQGTTTTVLHGNGAGNPAFGSVVDADLSLTTPALAGATATTQSAKTNSTKVATTAYVDAFVPNTVVDTSSPVTVSTTLGAEMHFNEHATPATAMTYNLPTAAAGKQFCISNAYNGSNPDTGVITIATSASGQFIIFTDGTLSATGGNVTSGGAAADAACVAGVDATHWMLYVQRGTWTKH